MKGIYLMNKQKVVKSAYHRNGVSGIGFRVSIVKEQEQGQHRQMLVVRFLDCDKHAGGVVCAAFDLALLDKREINFGVNSWRGDHYHETIDKYDETLNRVC